MLFVCQAMNVGQGMTTWQKYKYQQTKHFIVKEAKDKTCTLIDMSVPADRKIPLKELEKI